MPFSKYKIINWIIGQVKLVAYHIWKQVFSKSFSHKVFGGNNVVTWYLVLLLKSEIVNIGLENISNNPKLGRWNIFIK